MSKIFNEASLPQIRADLSPLQYSQPIEFGGVQGTLGGYFDYYGFAQVSNSIACGYRIGYIDVNGRRLVGHHWQLSAATSTVFVAHGLFDHVGIYLKLIKTLLANNFSVIALDMPGHGLSEGKRAEVEDFNRYSEAIIECLKATLPGLQGKILGLGQSAGGSAIMQYVLNTGTDCRFARIVLLAPLIRPSQWPLVNFSYITLCPFISRFPRSFTSNSHDRDFTEFLINDPLQPRYISLPWMGAMKDWIKRFDTYPVSDIPTLVVQGTSDKTVDWKNNLSLIQKRFPNTEIVMVKDARHHLVNEGDAWREQVFNATIKFLKNSQGG